MQIQARSIPHTARNSKTGTTVYYFAIAGFGVYLISLFIALRVNAAETTWVTVLFLIPPLAPIIGLGIHLKRGTPSTDGYFFIFSMWVSFFSTLFYCVLWVLYCYACFSNALSILSLIGIAILLGLIGILMCAFLQDMDETKWPRLFSLRNGASNEQLWALCFLFFVLFLEVSYLFGFAFAFHDRASLSLYEVPALYMTNVGSPDDMKAANLSSPAGNSTKQIEAGTQPSMEKPKETKLKGDSNFYFYFDSRRARLETLANEQCGLEDKPENIKPPQRVAWVSRDTRQFNYCSLEAIKTRLKQATRDGNRVRIILVGRSDDHPIKESRANSGSDEFTDYKSNYELSEARGQNVRFEIVRSLKETDDDAKKWLNLEWLSLPSSNEVPVEADQDLQGILQQTNLDKTQSDIFIDRNKRIVVASIAAIPGDITSLQMKGMWPRTLNLMDYMYFSIYTITTTGYGDIIPVTGFAKLIVSLANICEVLFLVVFVNALISLKVRRKQRRRKDSTQTVVT